MKKFFALLMLAFVFVLSGCGTQTPKGAVEESLKEKKATAAIEFYKKTEEGKRQEVAKALTSEYTNLAIKMLRDAQTSTTQIRGLIDTLESLQELVNLDRAAFSGLEKVSKEANNIKKWEKIEIDYAKQIQERYGFKPNLNSLPNPITLDCYITNLLGDTAYAYGYKKVATGFAMWGSDVYPTDYMETPDPNRMLGVIQVKGDSGINQPGVYQLRVIPIGKQEVMAINGFTQNVTKYMLYEGDLGKLMSTWKNAARYVKHKNEILLKAMGATSISSDGSSYIPSESLSKGAAQNVYSGSNNYTAGGTLSKGVAQDVSLRLMKNERNLKRLANAINGSGMKANQIDDHEFVAAPRNLAQRIKNEVGDGEVHELCDIQLERVQCMVDGVRGQKERFKEGGDLYDAFYEKYKAYCARYNIPYNGPNN